jgi:trimethylamine--corrinoid protein Co-methyltransferase
MQPTLSILSKIEITKIHKATLEMLNDPGILIEYEPALSLFAQAGAKVNNDRGTVRISHHLLADSLKDCSPVVLLHRREGLPPLKVGSNNTYFGLQGQVTTILDWRDNTYRESRCRDLEEACRVADMLENVSVMDPPCALSDVHPDIQDLYRWKIPLLNSRCHIMNTAFSPQAVKDAVEMGSAIAGDIQSLREKPFISFLTIVEGPLSICSGPASVIMKVAEFGLPLFIVAGPVSGANAPCTLAGSLASANALVLGSIVLAKLVNSNTPVIYASSPRPLDMRRGIVTMAAPECSLMRAAAAHLARFYRIPSGGAAIHTDSKLVDVQLGLEKMATLLTPSLSQVNLLLGLGLIDSGRILSLEALVIENEIINYARRILQGVAVDDERLGVHLFRELKSNNNFLSHRHTMRYHKEELWVPNLLTRSLGIESWLSGGMPNLNKAARLVLEQITSAHAPPFVSDESQDKIESIIKRRQRLLTL